MNKRLIFRMLRKMIRNNKSIYSENAVQYFDQTANDFVYNSILKAIKNRQGLMISKFGAVELKTICCYQYLLHDFSLTNEIAALKGEITPFPQECFPMLCNNAGFFPNNPNLGYQYTKLTLEDAKEIDIIGSYLLQEKFVKEISNAVKVNLEGYYAPFMWERPWSRILKGKKVLVIHPFTETIKIQYEKREKLFDNKDVLPTFSKLFLIKAVQSIAGNGINTGFVDWFDALEYMKCEIDKVDYDIALIGCGAYGMNLAAHVKRQRKIAIHLAGWTQMLFGIYGNRWIEDQPKFKQFINEYWSRPFEKERPQNAEKVENACYW